MTTTYEIDIRNSSGRPATTTIRTDDLDAHRKAFANQGITVTAVRPAPKI